ncbi:related to PCP1-mitochondrial serine protease [Sporisorium reilianum f. sp. reilianum]|uniref:Related to PCP1-mitochondrial serine protease n=1 Tax=Sporisorium reilianum f. sp. reilianum TaxID=72559 RepID=A0A2N8UBW8_9BASI|nr:related to PCP1-mitochondrial serine protease [Sporisorium reilianum f. sp. reilianum]
MSAIPMASSRERSTATTGIPPRSMANSSIGLPRPGSLLGTRHMATRSGSVARGASTITEPTATRPLWFKPPTASSFLRSFSSTCLHAPSLLLAAKPKHDLPTRDTPGRITARSRQRASPLSDRSSRLSPNARSSPPPPPPPPRRPSSTSSFAALAHRLDTRLFSRLPANFVLYTIIALNVLVFGSWLYAAESMRKFSDPRMYLFMSKNFLSGYLNVQQGRWWTMLTSCVSHETLDHFLLNMVSLAFMAPPVLALTGPTTFVLLYFGAGVVSSVVSMVGKALVPPDKESRFSAFSHGASGSVYAIMSAFACVHPRATFLVFFVVPAPAWLCVSGIFAWDLWHAAGTPKGRTDSAGHVGGILAGIAFWRFGLRGVRL